MTIIEEFKELKNSYLFRRPVMLVFLAVLIIIVGLQQLNFLNRPHESDPSKWAGSWVPLTGVISQMPDPRPRGTVFVLDAETIGQKTANGRVLIQASHIDPVSISPGDRVRVFGKITILNPNVIPGNFDYQKFLKSRDIHSVIYTSSRSVTNLGSTEKFQFQRWGWIFHQKAVHVFKKYLSDEEATVLSGLVVGARPRFHPEIKRIFVESGTMHILVASGSNVAFVVFLWYLAVRFLFRLPRRYCLVSSIPAIWLYVLMAGLDPPITRAGVMTTVGIISYVLAREDRAYNAFSLAALVILIPHPETLFEVGFQMSFITVFGMIYFLPRIDGWITTPYFGVRTFFRLLAATLTAQLWLVPITFHVFKRFFPLGLLANLIVIPLAAGGLALGFLMLAADFIHFPFPSIIQWTGHIYIQTIIQTVRFFANHPGAVMWVSTPGLLWAIGYYISCLNIVGIRKWQLCRVGMLIGILCMGGSWIYQANNNKIKDLKISWIDVGRHSSILIQTPERKNVVLNPDNMERVVMPYLAEKGIRKLDSLDDIQIQVLPTSKTFQTKPPYLFSYHDKNFLFAHVLSLKTQQYILRQGWDHFEIIQARF